MLAFALFALIQLFSPGCSQVTTNMGVARLTQVLYDVDSGVNVEARYNIWFKDSVTIQEIPVFNTVQDTAGNRTHSVSIKHYTYLNPKSNIYRDYRNFSDTAGIKKSYKSIAAAADGGAWDFYSDFPYTYESIENLSDSVIDNISYNRFKMLKNFNKIDFYQILYTRCDMKGFLIKDLKPVSDSIGCPIFITEIYFKKSGKMQTSFSIEIVKEGLSKKELEVFEAWGK